MEHWQGVLGLLAFCGIAWIFSEGRRRVRPVPVVVGIALQFVLALALLRVPPLEGFFLGLNGAVLALDRATTAGTSFVFGYLGGGELPFTPSAPAATFVLAFRALPLVLVVSALSSLLYYWRILPWIVRALAWVLQKTLHIGGAVGLGAAANIFVGMIEAPLFIRPYLREMTRAELFMVMTCGMATIAGTVMVLYANVLAPVLPNALGHILTASIISAPAAITIARIMVPESGPQTAGSHLAPPGARGAMDAITRGTAEGVTLLVNIVAMLVVLVALVALVNQLLALLPPLAGGGRPLTLQGMLGWVMAPLVWLMGVPWAEAPVAGSLMGTKVVLNELLAYLELAQGAGAALSERSRLIMVYALCGFANLGSLGIMIGGLGALVPERKAEVVALGLRSIMAGVLATAMTGAVVGLL
ncbi:MAG: nucleoside:proton symporter [Candidatus Lambdaproteobacteria bacterium]|nr:nucleoside:proton symporter [Candidatus Lambdaproteobacteria bacterium]